MTTQATWSAPTCFSMYSIARLAAAVPEMTAGSRKG